MLLWFVGLSVALVWVVFQSPALDYRLVAAGAVVPWVDAATGGPWVLHTLAGAVGALVVVMALTQRRRLVRRRWLGIPIGLFLHLVLDAVWTRTPLFWWPAGGAGAFDGGLPELDRPLLALVVMELAGAAALLWLWRGFELSDPAKRADFVRTGRLPR